MWRGGAGRGAWLQVPGGHCTCIAALNSLIKIIAVAWAGGGRRPWGGSPGEGRHCGIPWKGAPLPRAPHAWAFPPRSPDAWQKWRRAVWAPGVGMAASVVLDAPTTPTPRPHPLPHTSPMFLPPPAAHPPRARLTTVLFSWSSILSAAAGRTYCMCGAVGRLQGGGQSPPATRSPPPTTSILQPPRPPTPRPSTKADVAPPRCCTARPPRPRFIRLRETRKYR